MRSTEVLSYYQSFVLRASAIVCNRSGPVAEGGARSSISAGVQTITLHAFGAPLETSNLKLETIELRYQVDYPTQHRPILPVANRACIACRDRDWTALCAMAGSAEDPRQAVHADGHGIR